MHGIAVRANCQLPEIGDIGKSLLVPWKLSSLARDGGRLHYVTADRYFHPSSILFALFAVVVRPPASLSIGRSARPPASLPPSAAALPPF